MTGFIPQIASHGYGGCDVSHFLKTAPAEHIARYRRDCIGRGPFIIWDPNDDADGFMVAAMTIAELNKVFLDHFDGFLAEQTNL